MRRFTLGLWAAIAALGPLTSSAGEITVSFSGGILELTGTSAADSVSISGNPVRTVVKVGFRSALVPAPTFLARKNQVFQNVAEIRFVGNGGADDVQLRASSVLVNLTGGNENDTFSISGPTAGNVTIDTGEGDDRVSLQGTALLNLAANLGNGVNNLSLVDTSLSGLDVLGGTGPDTIIALRLGSHPTLGMLLNIVTGAGDDIVGFQESTITSNDPMTPGTLDGGDDNDSVGQDMSTFTPLPMPANFEVVIGFDPPPPPPAPRVRFGR